MTTTENIPNLTVLRTRGGDWNIDTPATITDRQAAAITWQADPTDVVLGDFVRVTDAGGVRIGHLATATYHKPWSEPAYVICGLELM